MIFKEGEKKKKTMQVLDLMKVYEFYTAINTCTKYHSGTTELQMGLQNELWVLASLLQENKS